jgi:hypothetical protein
MAKYAPDRLNALIIGGADPGLRKREGSGKALGLRRH